MIKKLASDLEIGDHFKTEDTPSLSLKKIVDFTFPFTDPSGQTCMVILDLKDDSEYELIIPSDREVYIF